MITKSQKGFSLIEVIIVVAIAASLVIIVSNLSGNVSGLNTLVSSQLQAKSDINQTVQILTSEIRSASAAQNGAYAIDSASSSSIIIYSDIDKDNVTERVRYFLASSTLFKGVTQPTGTPAMYVTSTEVITDLIDGISLVSSTPLFQYYGASYTGTQPALPPPIDVSQIRLVGITFYSAAAQNQSSSQQYFSTIVDIRNLRSN
jgi:prepilin-type N-terminal cleavage/methylation domain-containing protein